MKKKLDNIKKTGGEYVLDLRQIGGGREIFDTLDEAQDVRDQAFADKQNKEYIPRTTNPITQDVATSFKKYIRSRQDTSGDKLHRHQANLRFMFDQVPGLRKRKIMDVTTAYIEAEIVPVIFQQAHSTGLNRFNTLRQMLKYAVKNNVARTNPCREVDLPARPIKQKATPRISQDDIAAIIAQSGAYALRIKFAGSTGVRAGEHVAVGWDDLDLDGGVLTVTKARNRNGQIRTPKTRAGVRTIPLSDTLVADLREWKLAQPLSQRGRGLVFPTSTGSVADPANWRKRGLHPACDRAGLPRIRWHDLRHFYASVLIFGENNLTSAHITQFLGHTSIDFTLKQYAHWLTDPRRDKTLTQTMSAMFSI